MKFQDVCVKKRSALRLDRAHVHCLVLRSAILEKRLHTTYSRKENCNIQVADELISFLFLDAQNPRKLHNLV